MIIPETRKRPNWLKATLEDVEGHGAAKGTFRESKRPKRYSGYATYMTKLIEANQLHLKKLLIKKNGRRQCKKNINPS
jgi:hypothetical protein